MKQGAIRKLLFHSYWGSSPVSRNRDGSVIAFRGADGWVTDRKKGKTGKNKPTDKKELKQTTFLDTSSNRPNVINVDGDISLSSRKWPGGKE